MGSRVRLRTVVKQAAEGIALDTTPDGASHFQTKVIEQTGLVAASGDGINLLPLFAYSSVVGMAEFLESNVIIDFLPGLAANERVSFDKAAIAVFHNLADSCLPCLAFFNKRTVIHLCLYGQIQEEQ